MRPSLEEHLGSRAVARVIYGSIIALALLVALEDHPPTSGQAIAAFVGTAVAVALAELYSELIGREAQTHRRFHVNRLRYMAADCAPVFFGAAFPAIFFVLAAIGVMEVHTAFEVAKWTGVGLICAYGFLAARLSGSTTLRAVGQALVVGAIGVFLILLKSLTH